MAEFFRQSLWFILQRGASVDGGSFHDLLLGWIENPIRKRQPDPFQRAEPYFNGQQVIIARSSLVAQAAFDDGEDCLLLLPVQTGRPEVAKKLPSRFFQQVEVAAIIDMVAYRALSVGDPMLMPKNLCGHEGRVKAKG